MTTFIKNQDGSWRRDHERHDNVLIETSKVPNWLADHGVKAAIHSAIGSYRLPDGLVAIIGQRDA